MLNQYDRMLMDVTGAGEPGAQKKYFKHLGKLSVDNSPVVIIFKTVPKEPHNCLVIGPNFLNLNYRDAMTRLLEGKEGQASFDFGNILAKNKFQDGVNMLAFLHEENYIKKMPTKDIIVTYGPDIDGRIPLDRLNELLAKESNISLEELSVRQEPTKDKNIKNKKNGKETAKI